MEMKYDYDVFISYSSKDQKVAEGICGYLERYGLRCFVAYRDIPKGKVWAEAIADGIDDSAMMVVVFSQNFNRSKQVDREIELAAEDNKPILTYRISNDPFSGAKKYYLKNINWIDAFPNPQENFGKLYTNVCQLLGKKPLTTVNNQPQPKPQPKSLLWLWILLGVLALGGVVFGVKSGIEKKREEAAGFKYKTFTVNGVTFEMVAVKGGTFTMGAISEQGGDADSDEFPAHSVTLGDYYIGKFEVTQEFWEAVMGSNPSRFKGSRNPVERVSWDDCQSFIRKLNQLTGMNFRLPTEAEWEYAARGGSKSRGYKYSGSSNINDVAWYTSTTNDSGTKPVGTKTPNELGIYDMSGNVWEWCQDWYGGYGSGSQTNPQGPSSGSSRVLRGGSWGSNARYCRVSDRNGSNPGSRYNDSGLRLAL